MRQFNINLPQLLAIMTILLSVIGIIMITTVDLNPKKGRQPMISSDNSVTNNIIGLDLLAGVIVILIFSILWLFNDMVLRKFFANRLVSRVLSIMFSIGIMIGSIITIVRMSEIDKSYTVSYNRTQVDAMRAMIYTSGGMGLLTFGFSLYKDLIVLITH